MEGLNEACARKLMPFLAAKVSFLLGVEEFFTQIVSFFIAGLSYSALKLPEMVQPLITQVLTKPSENNIGPCAEGFGRAGYLWPKLEAVPADQCNMAFLDDKDLLAHADRPELIALHAALPFYNFNFMDADEHRKDPRHFVNPMYFTSYFKDQLAASTPRPNIPPQLVGLITPYLVVQGATADAISQRAARSTSKALVAAEKGRFSSSACVEATSLDFVARVSAYFLEFNPA